jgi:hypothetical protein
MASRERFHACEFLTISVEFRGRYNHAPAMMKVVGKLHVAALHHPYHTSIIASSYAFLGLDTAVQSITCGDDDHETDP